MKSKRIIEFLGYEWTTLEFTGMYLLELISSHPNVLIEEYPHGTTTKEVSIFFMGEEKFKNLLDEGYVEDVDGINNYKTTEMLQEYIKEFLGCLIKWEALVDKEKKDSRKKVIENYSY